MNKPMTTAQAYFIYECHECVAGHPCGNECVESRTCSIRCSHCNQRIWFTGDNIPIYWTCPECGNIDYKSLHK